MDLDDVNEYFLRKSLWPAVLHTLLMMLIGTLGNGLVLIVYRKEFHKSVTWIFIYFLAVLDFCTCLISMPSELSILFNIANFQAWAWCKASRYLTYVFHASSCAILMVIAFNRYTRICRPTSQCFTINRAKKICVGIVLFTLLGSSVSLLIYGDALTPLMIRNNEVSFITMKEYQRYYNSTQGYYNATTNTTTWAFNETSSNHKINDTQVLMGHMCIIGSEYSDSLLSSFFFLIYFLMYALLVVLVIYFYSRVIRKMLQYKTIQDRKFQLYIPEMNSKDSCEEFSLKHNQSKDVKAENSYQEVSCDPLSESIINFGSMKRSDNKRTIPPKIVTTSAANETHPSNCHLQNDTTSIDGLGGLPDITGPITNHSENTIKNRLSLDSTDFVQDNSLLCRRIKSMDNHVNKINTNTFTPLVVQHAKIEENKTPLFLHANKTHRKRGTNYSERRADRKYHSDEQVPIHSLETKDDLYLHKETGVQQLISKSMELLTPTHLGQLNDSQKTIKLNRLSPKGSTQCVLPISGLSIKSATAYDDLRHSHKEVITVGGSQTSPFTNNDHSVSQITDSSTKEYSSCNESQDTILTSEKDKADPKSEEIDSITSHVQNDPESSTRNSVAFRIDDNDHRARSQCSRSPHRVIDSASIMFNTPHNGHPPAMTFRRAESTVSRSSNKAARLSRQMSVKPIKALKTSSMLLCISLVFVFSFLPFWIIVITRAMSQSFVSSLDATGFGTVALLIRFSLISNAFNPIVYGLLNTQFRNQCKRMILGRR